MGSGPPPTSGESGSVPSAPTPKSRGGAPPRAVHAAHPPLAEDRRAGLALVAGFLLVVGLLSLVSGGAEIWSVSHASGSPTGCAPNSNCTAARPIDRQAGLDSGVAAASVGVALLLAGGVLWLRVRRREPPERPTPDVPDEGSGSPTATTAVASPDEYVLGPELQVG